MSTPNTSNLLLQLTKEYAIGELQPTHVITRKHSDFINFLQKFETLETCNITTNLNFGRLKGVWNSHAPPILDDGMFVAIKTVNGFPNPMSEKSPQNHGKGQNIPQILEWSFISFLSVPDQAWLIFPPRQWVCCSESFHESLLALSSQAVGNSTSRGLWQCLDAASPWSD